MNFSSLHRIVILPLLTSFINTKELALLDVAITNARMRVWFLVLLTDEFFDTEGFEKNCTTSYAKWLIARNVKTRIVTIKQIINPRLDSSVQIFDRLVHLNIHMNTSTEAILKQCSRTLKTLKLVGSCSSQSSLLFDVAYCRALTSLDIGHFSFSSSEERIVSFPIEKMSLIQMSCSSPNISEFFLQTLFLRSPSITNLNLNGCTQFTDSSLLALCESCLSIVSLSVGKSKVTDSGIVAMSKALKEIIELDLNRCASVTSVGILAIEKAYRSTLRGLNINFCTQVDNNALSAVHENCRALKTLSITGCKGLSNHRILQVLHANAAMHITV